MVSPSIIVIAICIHDSCRGRDTCSWRVLFSPWCSLSRPRGSRSSSLRLRLLRCALPSPRRTHGFFAALTVLALPLLYGISAFFSAERSLALGGFSVETDTVLFVILAALAYLLSFTFFCTLRTARLLTTVVFWSLAAAAVFQLVSVLFGSSAIPFDAFADRTVNLIGKWNDLGLIAALLGLLLLVRVELGPTSQFSRIASAVAGALRENCE